MKKVINNNFEKILKVKKEKTEKDIKNYSRKLKRKLINERRENGYKLKYNY